MLCCTMFSPNAFLTIVILTGVVSHAEMIFLTTGDIFDKNWTESTGLEHTLSHTLETDPNDDTTTTVNPSIIYERISSTKGLGSSRYTAEFTGEIENTHLTIGPDSCYPNPCQNGGTCYIDKLFKDKDKVRCICNLPYYGRFCENYADPCVPNPCKNGGICYIDKNQRICMCKKRFYGKFCEEEEKSVIEEWKDIILISVTSVTLFMMVVIATCLLCWWVRLSKRSAESV